MAVGAVTADREKAYFSSFGPTYDGRIKPSVAARGFDAVVGTPTYRVDSASGTSFASPIMAGMVTSLWQAFPNKRNLDIIHAVEQSADQAHNPNNSLGYGIPDMMKAFRLLSNMESNEATIENDQPSLIANYELNTYDVVFNGLSNTKAEVSIFNSLGQQIDNFTAAIKDNALNRLRLDNLPNFTSGYYVVCLTIDGAIYRIKVFKA
jgi:subtilisin family serine protease